MTSACPLCLEILIDRKATFCETCFSEIETLKLLSSEEEDEENYQTLEKQTNGGPPSSCESGPCEIQTESISNSLLLTDSWFKELNCNDQSMSSNIGVIEVKCEECGDGVASSWCESCDSGTYYCNDCNTKLHGGNRSSNHIRYSMEEKAKRRPSFLKCNLHHKSKKFYCVDDKQFICQVCSVDDHPGHKIISAFMYAELLRKALLDCVLPFQTVLGPLGNIEKVLLEKKEKNDKKLEKLENRVKELKEKSQINELEIIGIKARQEKVKTSQQYLIKIIEEKGVMDLIDNNDVEMMKKKIAEVLLQVYPRNIEEERIEKMEKERLEKEPFLSWVMEVLILRFQY